MAVTAAEVDLVTRLRERDESAFDEFVEAYRPRIRRWAGRLVNDPSEIDDIAQEVLLASWRTAQNLREDTVLAPWLKTITDNACRIRARTRQRKPAVPSGLVPDQRGACHLVDVAQMVDVEAALQSMPEREAGILRLLYSHDMSIEEAASVLNVSPDAAKSLAARARRRFRHLFEGWFKAVGSLILPAGKLFELGERVPRDAVRAGVAAAVAVTVASVATPPKAPEHVPPVRAETRAAAAPRRAPSAALVATFQRQNEPAGIPAGPVLIEKGPIEWMETNGSGQPHQDGSSADSEYWASWFMARWNEWKTQQQQQQAAPKSSPSPAPASPSASSSPAPSATPAPSAAPSASPGPSASPSASSSPAPASSPNASASGPSASKPEAGSPAASPSAQVSWWNPATWIAAVIKPAPSPSPGGSEVSASAAPVAAQPAPSASPGPFDPSTLLNSVVAWFRMPSPTPLPTPEGSA